MKISQRLGLVAVVLSSMVWSGAAVQAEDIVKPRPIPPVVLFPAFHFTVLKVGVEGQTVAPECPASGRFEDGFPNDQPSAVFNQICRDKLLTLVYDANPSVPMPERFSNQPGVTVAIKDFGKTTSAPFYERLYRFLELNGYQRDKSIRVAGYDSRLTPDMDGFLRRSIDLIERTYHDNDDTPVHLVAHSNGPLYAQYLLTHTSQTWKDKYIHGFSPIAGNWPGQGSLYSVLFTGLNIIDFLPPQDPANAASSARMYLSHPSSYMSAADPAIFGNQEVVIQALSNGHAYTPQDNVQLFQDAGLPIAQELGAYYIGFVKFADPASFPNVDVYAEKGSGVQSLVGAVLQDLSVGQVLDLTDPAKLILAAGDGNQEAITNDAVQVWQNMACHHFELVDSPNVDHFSLPSSRGVLTRLIHNLRRPRTVCP